VCGPRCCTSGVQYLRPGLRGWLHLVWFEVSLIAGTLMLAITHGAARITAVAVYTATVSGLFGTNASWHRGSRARCVFP
jgi:hemolysin III